MPSDILFEKPDWQPAPELPKGAESAWTNGHATIYVHHLGLDKNLRSRLNDNKAARDYYRAAFAKDGIGLIECDVLEIEGSRAVRAIGKVVRPQNGATYIGAVAVPLAGESYVFNTLARERGHTGLREAVVMLEITKEIEAQGYVLNVPSDGRPGQTAETKPQSLAWKNPTTGAIRRWCEDPYEPDYDGPCLRNLADAPEYDQKVPGHPLSEVRATLRALVQDVRFSPELKKRAERKRGWRFW